ncbi:MAG: cytochrome P450, partial [Candidatus Binatus sp.]
MPPSDTLPPGPALFATFDFIRNPFRFLDECARRYGDWFTVRVPGVAPFVFTSDPTAVREVFLGDPGSLHAGDANRPLGAFMGERSSLFLDGDEHLRQRRLLLPAFHGKQVASHADAMRTAADNAIASWPIRQPFPIHPQMRSITFETIIRAVFGFADDSTGAKL